jgi:hypothetical protein
VRLSPVLFAAGNGEFEVIESTQVLDIEGDTLTVIPTGDSELLQIKFKGMVVFVCDFSRVSYCTYESRDPKLAVVDPFRVKKQSSGSEEGP